MFLLLTLPGAAHVFQVSTVSMALGEDGVPGLPPCPGFTGNVLRPEGLGSSAFVLAASSAYTTHLTATIGISNHEPKAGSDLSSLSLSFASYLLHQASLRDGPSPWANQLFSCGISRRELAAEDCLLVTLPAAEGLNPSLLKGNLGGYP